MLKEKGIFKAELPVNVVTANIEKYPIHFHDEMEVVFVLSGEVILRNGYYNYKLHEGDIFILNDREMHSFEKTGEENMVMMLQLDMDYFAKYYKNLKNSFFVTDMDDDNDESLEVLKGILVRIMMEMLQKGFGYEHKVIESTHNLISCLIENFQYFVMEDGKFVNESKNKGNKILTGRLNRITDYMYDNYSRKLTLNEIAEREHLSIYYLSHVIKEATGLSFQDLLSFIRVEESEKLLLGSNKKIGTIAAETGFSAVRYYIKHFETWYKMSPLEYRRKYTGKIFSRETPAQYVKSSPDEIEKAVRHHDKNVYSYYTNRNKETPEIIELDVSEEYGRARYVTQKESGIHQIMEREIMAPAAEPYKVFCRLKKSILKEGNNYIIATSSQWPGALSSVSILIYNYDEKTGEAIMALDDKMKITEKLVGFDKEKEFLIRCSGMRGQYKISRLKLSKENILMAFKLEEDEKNHKNERSKVVEQWMAMPSLEFGDIKSTGIVTVRATMKGFSGELILVEKQ